MAKTTPPFVQLDPAHLHTELASICKAASDLAETIEHIGIGADAAIESLYTDASDHELATKAATLQSAVLQGHTVLATLQLLAGKLAFCSWLRGVATSNDHDDQGAE